MVNVTPAGKLKDEKFSAYLEESLRIARSWGWQKEITAKENLAWEIHEQFPPTGSLLLGYLLLEQKTSFVKRDMAKNFAKTLLAEAFKAVLETKEKDGWDFYYLGLCYAHGRSVLQDFSLAAQAFSDSAERGNLYAKFEAIWARYLAGGSRLEAILEFTDSKGKLADFAASSAQALALLDIGPTREPGSPARITRILLLGRALHDFIFHSQGTRHINVAIEKEFREESEELLSMDSSRGYLGLYLIARRSRSNPTGKQPLDWFQKAIDPTMLELQVLCRRQDLGVQELRMIIDRAKVEGWLASPLALLAANGLEGEDAEEP